VFLINDYEHLKGPTAPLKRCTPIARDVDGCLAPPIDLPPWQLAAAIANRPKPPRIRQALHRGRMVLRIHALIEAVIPHPGVFARLLKRHRAVASAYRAAEGLRSVVGVAQLAEMQPGIASADITPDPQGPEDFAKRAEAIGYATEGTDHVARLEPRSGQRRINFLPAVLACYSPAEPYACVGVKEVPLRRPTGHAFRLAFNAT
jgi:hypothetical protein